MDGLACPDYAYGIERKIKALDGVDGDSVNIRPSEGLVVFQANTDTVIGETKPRRLLNDTGFTLRGLNTRDPDNEITSRGR